METRELYKQKYEAQIHEWGARVVAFKAHTDKLTAEAKIDMKPRIDAVHSKFAAAEAKLGEIADATDDKWDDVMKSADHAWSEAKAAVEGAYDAIKPAKKH